MREAVIPEELRRHLRNADRQILVDFVNTLEDISCSASCEEHWGSNAGFWRGYFVGHLSRAQFYLEPAGGEQQTVVAYCPGVLLLLADYGVQQDLVGPAALSVAPNRSSR